MAVMPPGMLSFLYNVMHDTDMNQKFREDPHEVMEFFSLSDEQRQFIEKLGLEVLALRVGKEVDLEARQDRAKTVFHARDSSRDAKIQAKLDAIGKFDDTVPVGEIQKIAETHFADSSDNAKQMYELILDAVEDDLKKYYARFW